MKNTWKKEYGTKWHCEAPNQALQICSYATKLDIINKKVQNVPLNDVGQWFNHLGPAFHHYGRKNIIVSVRTFRVEILTPLGSDVAPFRWLNLAATNRNAASVMLLGPFLKIAFAIIEVGPFSPTYAEGS